MAIIVFDAFDYFAPWVQATHCRASNLLYIIIICLFNRQDWEKVYFRSQILECSSIGEYWNIFGVPVLPENVIFMFFRMYWCYHTCQLFLFWRNSSSFRSKKENDFIMCSCFCSNLCIVMYRKFRNVPLFKFFSLICSSFWNLKVGKYVLFRSLQYWNAKMV